MKGLRSVKTRNVARRVGHKTTPLKIAKAKSGVPAVLIPTSPIKGDIMRPYVLKHMAIPKIIRMRNLPKKGRLAKMTKVHRPRDIHQKTRIQITIRI
jgi:hypothetical protein